MSAQIALSLIRHTIEHAGDPAAWWFAPEGTTLREVHADARRVLESDPALAKEHMRAVRIRLGIPGEEE